MDFSLSEDQRAFQETALSFAAEHFTPNAARWDEDKIFPEAELRLAAELGFGGIYVRDEVGGSGLSRLDAAIIFEEL
ncbi:acyl-CoA dehydrogenase family protein, partial [Acinetobacter baumannii]